MQDQMLVGLGGDAPPDVECLVGVWQLPLPHSQAGKASPASSGRWPLPPSHSSPVAPPPSPCPACRPLPPILVPDSMLLPAILQMQEGVCGSGEKGHPKALPLTDHLRGPQDHETVQPKVLAGGLPVDRLHGTGHHTCGALLRTLLRGGLLVDLFPSQLLMS